MYFYSFSRMYSNCTSQYFEKANCVPELQSKHSATHFYYGGMYIQINLTGTHFVYYICLLYIDKLGTLDAHHEII